MIHLQEMKEQASSGNIPEDEQENELSLYNFKLAGLYLEKIIVIYQ